MKTVIENVIKTGRYELKDMLTKLDTAWYQGQISYDERNEMMQLAADAYYTGSKVTENGKKYECTAPEGFAVTYPPSVLPSMWSEVTL